MIEIRELLRLWLEGRGLREVARLSGTYRKTVRRYVEMAQWCGVDRGGGVGQLTDELLAAVIAGVRRTRPNGKVRRGRVSLRGLSRSRRGWIMG